MVECIPISLLSQLQEYAVLVGFQQYGHSQLREEVPFDVLELRALIELRDSFRDLLHVLF